MNQHMMEKAKQAVSAATEWKNRMRAAKEMIPSEIGMQRILNEVVRLNPDLDRLTNATRWRNAWFMKAADPEFTRLVEQVAQLFNDSAQA